MVVPDFIDDIPDKKFAKIAKDAFYDKHDKPKSVKKVSDKPVIKQIDNDKRLGTDLPQNKVSKPPMTDSGDIDLNQLFSSEVGNQNDVLKELFSGDNVKTKTELTRAQISIISRLELQAGITQNFYLARVLKEFETLMISRDRMSRQEFVRSFYGADETSKQATIFGKLGNIFNKDKV